MLYLVVFVVFSYFVLCEGVLLPVGDVPSVLFSNDGKGGAGVLAVEKVIFVESCVLCNVP